MENQFYLRYSPTDTGSNVQFWGAKGGYTTDVGNAAVYTREEAQRKHDGRCGDDMPLAKHLVDDALIRAVDYQYLPENFELADFQEFVIQPKELSLMNGNDIYFVSEDGESRQSMMGYHGPQDYNYENAKVFTLEEAKAFLSKWQPYADDCYESEHYRFEYVIYPKALIDKLARSTFQVFNIDSKKMITKQGIDIYKPPKQPVERYNCAHCGRFVSLETYYSRVYAGHPCKRCEDD